MFNFKKSTFANKIDYETSSNKQKNSTIMGDIFQAVLFSSFFAILLFMLGYAIYIYKLTLRDAVIKLSEQTESIATETTHYFSDITAIIDILTYSRNLKKANEIEENKSYLLDVLTSIGSKHSGLNDIIVAYEDETIITKSTILPKNYNLKEAKWYKEAIKTNNNLVTLEYIPNQKNPKNLKLLISRSFVENAKNKGVIAADCKLDSLYKLIVPNFFLATNSLFLVNRSDKQIISNNPSPLEQKIVTSNPQLFTNGTSSFSTKIDNIKYLVFARELPGLDWFIISSLKYSEITKLLITQILIILLILIALVIVSSKTLSIILGRKFAKPVIEVSTALKKLAEGNKNIQPINAKLDNEIGEMSVSFNTFLKETNILKFDLTELKKTKDVLSYSLSLLDASLESTDDGILILDNDKNIIKMNTVFSHALGITKEHINEQENKFLVSFYREKIVNYEQVLQTVIETNENPEIISSSIIELINGLVLECHSFPQKIDAKVVGRVWRCRDITEIRKAKQILQDSEERYRVMFTETIDAFSILEGDKIIDTNQAALDMLGVTKEWFLGKTPLEVSPEHQPNGKLSKDGVRYHIQQALEKGKHTFTWEHIRSDGTSFPAEISLVKFKFKTKELLLVIWKDLTEEKRLVEQLKSSEQNFRLFFESMEDMIFISDYRGNIKYINQATQDKLGYNIEELASMTILDIHQSSVTFNIEEFMKHLMEGKCSNCDLPLKTKEGKLIEAESKTWLGKWNGEASIFGISKDITKEQEALIKFNKIFENNPNPLMLTGYPDKKFIDVNDAFCRILGFSKDELIGVDIEDFELNLDLNKIATALEKLAKEGKFSNLNIKVNTKNGHVVDGLFSGELIETTGTKFVLTAMTDITNIKRLDKMLRKSEKKYRLLFENMATGFALHEMIYDEHNKPVDYRFLDINPAFEKFTGLEAKKIIGKRIKEILPKTEDYWIQTYGQVVKTKQAITYEQYSSQFDKYFEVKAFSPEPNKFATIFSDTTSRVKALSALEKEKELAQAATKAKSEFLANMSHEIRTPLNGVIGFTDLLLSTELTPNQKEYSINANISGKALLSIINDILDFSKIEAGKMELDKIDCSILTILEQTVDVVKFSAAKKGVDVILNIPPNFPEKALVDPLRIKQILLNLLNNAVKFTKKGEIELSAKFTPLGQNTGSFSFSVRDTGLGISAKSAAKLFNAFTQADNSITRKYGGTGLGLVISNFLAGKMGSKIELISEVGVGSEFYFTLTTQFSGLPESKEGLLTGNRILLADRNARFRKLTKTRFEYWGLEVDLAANKTEIMDKIHSKQYKVLILDERLMDKKDYSPINDLILTSKSKKNQTYAIITSSAQNNIEIADLYKSFDISHILAKPLLSDKLFNILVNLCSNINTEERRNKTPKQVIDFIKSDKKLKVLIAEDVEMNMILIKALLKKIIAEVEIYEAKNGKEAVYIYTNQPVDLILMDVQMPELDGLEATKAIKKIQEKRKVPVETPIIALTAAAFADDKEKCLAVGMEDFLTKPISIVELKNVLGKYIRN